MVCLVDVPPTAPSFPRPLHHLVPIATSAPLAHANGPRVCKSHGPWCIVGSTHNLLPQGVETMHVVLPS